MLLSFPCLKRVSKASGSQEMGKEWSWGGRSTTTKRAEREASGCMSGVLQLFPLHQPCFKTPDSFLQEDPTILKGIEAPRNSLESEEGPCMGTVRLSSLTKEGDLNLPIARRGEAEGCMVAITSETSISPVTKTPNLVARLMGLDLLPDTFFPSSSSTSSTSSSVNASSCSRGNPHQEHHLKEKLACAAVTRDLRSRRTMIHSRSNSNINFIGNEVRYEMTGSRSLPDTPRISSSRRSSDTDPRLSLQINKENLMIPPEEFASRMKEWRQGDENRNPSYYARQVVKQVKENVGRRKVGLDITNTTRNGASEGDSPTIKSQKTRLLSHTKVADESSPGKYSTPSRSPRFRLSETQNKRVTATSTSHDHFSQSPRPSSQASLLPSTSASTDYELQRKASRKPKVQPSNQPAKTRCKKGSSSSSKRFAQRLTKPPQISETVRNMSEEAFVRATPGTKSNLSEMNCKKTPLSNDLVNIAVPSVVQLKKDNQQSSTIQKPVAQGSKRTSQLSSCLSQTYNRQEVTETPARQDDNKENSTGSSKNGGIAEFRYVNGILRSTGIYRDAFVSITRWFSPYHLLNPLTFHHLEYSFSYSKIDSNDDDDDDDNDEGEEREKDVDRGPLRHRCNRKLLFQLVDEILVEVLRPYLNMKPWIRSIHRGSLLPVSISKDTQMTGLQLLELLWSRIQSFPAANCQILQDIDALVEKDLQEASMRTALSYSEEGESIVLEIERDILDSLLHETAAAFDSVGVK